MGQATVGRRWWSNKTRLFINVGLIFLGCLFLFLLGFIITVWENKPLFATSIMALAIVATAGISLVSIRQNLHMLTLNQRMIEEMRRSRPQPSITAHIEKSTRPAASIPFSKGNRSISHSGETYDLVVKNVGREFARDIKVDYCTREIPESKPGEKPRAYDESQLVDSCSIGITSIRPLGPGDDYRANFDFITDPKIRYIKIIKITYSDGVESYQTGPYRLDTWGQRIG